MIAFTNLYKKKPISIFGKSAIFVMSGVGSVTIIFKYAPPIKLASTFCPYGKIVRHPSGKHWSGAND